MPSVSDNASERRISLSDSQYKFANLSAKQSAILWGILWGNKAGQNFSKTPNELNSGLYLSLVFAKKVCCQIVLLKTGQSRYWDWQGMPKYVLVWPLYLIKQCPLCSPTL